MSWNFQGTTSAGPKKNLSSVHVHGGIVHMSTILSTRKFPTLEPLMPFRCVQARKLWRNGGGAGRGRRRRRRRRRAQTHRRRTDEFIKPSPRHSALSLSTATAELGIGPGCGRFSVELLTFLQMQPRSWFQLSDLQSPRVLFLQLLVLN